MKRHTFSQVSLEDRGNSGRIQVTSRTFHHIIIHTSVKLRAQATDMARPTIHPDSFQFHSKSIQSQRLAIECTAHLNSPSSCTPQINKCCAHLTTNAGNALPSSSLTNPSFLLPFGFSF